jgi:hypothetical protein
MSAGDPTAAKDTSAVPEWGPAVAVSLPLLSMAWARAVPCVRSV